MRPARRPAMLLPRSLRPPEPVLPARRRCSSGKPALSVNSLLQVVERQCRLMASHSIFAHAPVRPAFLALPAGAGPIAALVLASLLWGTADVQDVRVGGRCFGALTGFLVSGRKP